MVDFLLLGLGNAHEDILKRGTGDFEAMDTGYRRLYNGGSRNINTGLKSNTFAMSCEGNEIKLYVNGVLERTVEDNTYNLPEGLIGVGVSSFDSTPVIIDFDYVTIDVP